MIKAIINFQFLNYIFRTLIVYGYFIHSIIVSDAKEYQYNKSTINFRKGVHAYAYTRCVVFIFILKRGSPSV